MLGYGHFRLQLLSCPAFLGKEITSQSLCLSSPQMQQMYDMIMQHKRAMQDMQLLWEKALQQHQHGYDSDEEVDSELGTWEHQLRRMEMDKTRGVWGTKDGSIHSSAPSDHDMVQRWTGESLHEQSLVCVWNPGQR